MSSPIELPPIEDIFKQLLAFARFTQSAVQMCL